MLPRIALALLIPACTVAQNADGPKPRAWGKVAGSYQLSITSDKDRYEAGEPIRIVSILKNVGGHAIMFRRSRPETTFLIEVLMPAEPWLPWRTRAALTPYGEKGQNLGMNGVASGDIPAGHEVENEFEINKLYEMSAPGDYLVTFQCRQPTIRIAEMDGKDHPMVDVTSNAITVTVLPKPR